MRTKKILCTAGIVLAVIVTTSINGTETKAGIFGQKGNLKSLYVPVYTIIDGHVEERIGTELECMYSLKSNCDRSVDYN